VAVPIVDLLEAVDVEQQQRQRRAVAAHQLELTLQVFVEGGAVAKPRQRVPAGVQQGLLVGERVAQRMDQEADTLLDQLGVHLVEAAPPAQGQLPHCSARSD
jgi:hypothetical protein